MNPTTLPWDTEIMNKRKQCNLAQTTVVIVGLTTHTTIAFRQYFHFWILKSMDHTPGCQIGASGSEKITVLDITDDPFQQASSQQLPNDRGLAAGVKPSEAWCTSCRGKHGVINDTLRQEQTFRSSHVRRRVQNTGAFFVKKTSACGRHIDHGWCERARHCHILQLYRHPTRQVYSIQNTSPDTQIQVQLL